MEFLNEVEELICKKIEGCKKSPMDPEISKILINLYLAKSPLDFM